MKNIFRFRHGPVRDRAEVNPDRPHRWPRLLLPLVSAAALGWFLVRVIPKPIRATYPCQRAAFPLATAFVIWLLGVKTSLLAWLKLRERSRRLRPALAFASGICLLAAAALAANQAAKYFGGSSGPLIWTPIDPPNSPMGVSKGIFPSRVVWMRDTNATPWNGVTGHWWDNSNGVNQAAVERMMSCDLQALTGTGSDAAAWDKVFRFYNTNHARGDVGYRTNEAIAVKINCNNCYDGYGDVDNQIDASPQSMLALLRQLVYQAGVPQNKITIYEAVRFIPNRIINQCRPEFPGVVWMDSAGTNGVCQQVTWHTNAFSYSANSYLGNSIPEPVYQATYLINLALLKGHWHAGVSLTAKNHLGTINGAPHNHAYIDAYTLPMGTYHPFVDLIGTRQLGGKTALFMIEGLYGIRMVTDTVTTNTASWSNLFAGQWSASYLMSLDPVAIDSVGIDFLRSEFRDSLGSTGDPNTYGRSVNCDNYLHEAAQADDPPSGIVYAPDGTTLTSLGVHEHWNNATNKQYSRNLGATNGIELIKIEASTNPAVAITSPASGTTMVAATDVSLQALVADGNRPTRKVDFYCGATLLGTATNIPFNIVWNNPPVGSWALTAVATDTGGSSGTSAVVNVSILPSAAPVISQVAISNNLVTVTFSTVSSHTYRLDFTGTLTPAAWTNLAPAQTATSSSLTFTDAVSGHSQRFYRAVLVK